MKSRAGCETCRQRKLKCDEQKPTCDRCRKAGRSCVPGSIFRHQETPAVLDASVDSQRQEPPVSRGVDCVRPRQGGSFTFVYVNDPYLDDATTDDATRSHSAIASPSAAIHEDLVHHSNPAAPSTIPSRRPSPEVTHERADAVEAVSHTIPDPGCEHAAVIDTREQPAGLSATPQGTHLDSGVSLQENRDTQLDGARGADADPVLSVQLVWYFKEVPGKWMDLYDVTAYFTFYVPRLAATRPLLRSACCALASKHIRRLLESHRSGLNTRLPYLCSEYWRRNLTTRNWNYESAAFYDDAIRLLMDEIARVSDLTDMSSDRSHRSEEALAAIAILCVYELLDAPGPEWSAHMSALPLLETAPAQILDTLSPQPLPRGLSKRSIFWNFVRQDYLYAFIHGTRTRLNPDDPQFWRESGLFVDSNGFPQPHGAPDASNNLFLEADEDLVSHTLFWVLGKIANFIAAMGELDVDGCSAPAEMQSTDELAGQWKALDLGLRQWHMDLPPSFSSFVRTALEGSGADVASRGSPPSFDRITYTIPTCGSTMQNYHMARILLLMNKPPQRHALRATFTERLISYRRIHEEVAHHSREICGISLSSPPDSVRIQSVQPLFVAGQCLSELRERSVVVDLLRGIEQDLGWATGYRVRKLAEEWEACLPD